MKLSSILVVDDEPDNFDVIETLLSEHDYELHYAANGPEAIASLDIYQPDLILLDVMMPGVDGITICQQIKAISKWQAVPIIMVTALSTKEDLARCLQAGADDFISKPINSLELRARVHSMLRIKQQHDRIQAFSKVQRNTINLLSNNLQMLRGNLIASLPHELKTPINGILGSITLLMEGVDEMDSESIHELLDISYRSTCRLERLTQRFLNYIDLELAEIALRDATGTTSNDASISSALIGHLAQTIAVQADRAEDLVCQVEAIEMAVSIEHLHWIVSELMDNAFKFSHPQTAVTVRGECRDKMFHLSVGNQGRGMTQEQIASIGAFMQFERPTYEQQGAGLGLKIVQKAVDLYNGRFLITSLYEQGMTVNLTLPLVNSEQQAVKLTQR
jgi:two-component system, sensor histidine kinase and response regulator